MKTSYYFKKIAMAILTIFLASLLTFVLLRFMPGDIIGLRAIEMSQERGISLEEARRLVASLYNFDPDEPLIQQVTRYYGALLRGDLGTSMTHSGIRVSSIIAFYMPWTLFLVSIALVLSYTLGIWLGSIMAWRRKSPISAVIAGYATIVQAIPPALVPTIVLVIFAFNLRWFPIQGAHGAHVTPGLNLPFIFNVLHHAALPVLAFVTTQITGWVMNMKGSCINVMAEDYVTAGYARGLSEATIRTKYVKKNALLPLYTSLAISFGGMLGGAPFMEGPFIYPGIGAQLGLALGHRDFTTAQGILLITISATIVASLAVEFIMPKLDPRIKMEE